MNLERIRHEVRFENVRSRGPGGQNVNKVSSAAILYWNFHASVWLTPEQKQRLSAKLMNRINREGEIFVRSEESRDLIRNKERGIEKLMQLVREALHVPKTRKKTKPTKSSQRKRREEKARRGETKKRRQRVNDY